MTYADIVEKRAKLEAVNFLPEADGRFIYAVARNKEKMDSIIRALDNIRKPSDEYINYQRELFKIDQKYALKDDDGTIQYITIVDRFGPQKRLKKIVGDGNPDSPYEKEKSVLRKKYDKDIQVQEAKEKKYLARLNDEVPEDDYRIFWIDADIIPNGLHPVGMEGCLHFVREPEKDNHKKPVKRK